MKKTLLAAVSLLTATGIFGQQARLSHPLLPKNATTKHPSAQTQKKRALGAKKTNHLNSTNSVVSFSEDFDGIPGPTAGGAGTYAFPTGWTLSNVDNLTPNTSVAYVNEAWERREDFNFNVADSCAFSTSWYTPAGTANDFMWTPAIINVPANSVLSWNAVAYDPSYPDGYEVRIMTVAPTGGTGVVGNQLTNSTVLFSTAAENTSWTSRSVSLNAYAGQTVYIGFRNNTTDMFLLLIDDIVVQTLVNYDAAVTSIDTTSEYTQIPLKQATPVSLKATILNNGSSALTNVQLKADVLDAANNIVYTNTSAAMASLASGVSASFTLAPATFAYATGMYKIKYYPITTETDQESSNDTALTSVTYSDYTYARDSGVVTGGLGIGAGNGGYIGQTYQINATADLTTITTGYTRGYTGTKYAAVVYSTLANGTPDAIIASTDTLLYPDDSARVYTVNIHGGPITLTPGNYVVAAVEFDSTLSLAQTTNIFTLGKQWVNWPTSPFSGWANIEAFGSSFQKPFMLRANFELPVAASFTAPVTVCPGSISFTDTAMYATSYNWSFPGGNPASSSMQSPVVSYTAAGTYTATLVTSNNNGDAEPVAQAFMIDIPVVTASASDTLVCSGSQTTLNGGGALTYTWTNSVSDGVAFTPTNSATYIVTGMDANGCSAIDSVHVTVTVCTGITSHNGNNVAIYPNPTSGVVNISLSNGTSSTIEVYNSIGQMVFSQAMNTLTESVNLSSLSNGMYSIRIKQNDTYSYRQNIIVNK